MADARLQKLLAQLHPLHSRAIELARGHRDVTPAHLAAALLEDDGVAEAVEACGADLEVAAYMVLGCLDEVPRRRFWHLGAPRDDVALVGVFRRALGHAYSAEVETVTAPYVLVHVLSQPSLLADRFDGLGVEALALRRYVAHGRVDDAPIGHGSGGGRVVLLDDPFTSMELVVEVLTRFFGHSEPEAERLMRRVHERGRGSFPFVDWDRARLQTESALRHVRTAGLPLEITLESSR